VSALLARVPAAVGTAPTTSGTSAGRITGAGMRVIVMVREHSALPPYSNKIKLCAMRSSSAF